MSRDVAGVTSPMLYVAMLYSWFAWHVEDHELHSLNYLHFGKPKTWYGVPRDAMLAFEDTVRVYGYGDDLNAIMAFQTLNQKTTVLSPAVLLSAGVPCCRLVQNPGEFVITFPGAYHSGFSHGFNCGEATNIATPLWLLVAKEAAIRRASTNCGPMVSHYQLLYKLALSLRQREPKDFHTIPRSSRLRDKKKKDEADIIVKEKFVGNVVENNNLLSILLDKTSCIIVPEIAFPRPFFSKMMVPEVIVKQSLAAGHCSVSRQAVENMSVDVALDNIKGVDNVSGPQSVTEASFYACNRKLYETKYGEPDTAALGLSTPEMQNGVTDKHRSHREGGLLDHGRLPCVQCGILSFACVAIIQPREAAVQFVMSREGISSSAKVGELSNLDSISNWISGNHGIVPPQGQASGAHSVNLAQVSDHCRQLYDRNTNGCTSALGLLASMYESSDSEEEKSDDVSTDSEKHAAANQGKDIQFLGTSDSCPNTVQHERANLHLYEEGCETRNTASLMKPIKHNSRPVTWSSRDTDIGHFARLGEPGTSYEQCSVYHDLVDDLTVSGVKASPDTCVSRAKSSIESDMLTMLKYNKDSCRMHVFCLEHALETWTQLQEIGGANVMLLCHPEYPRAESAAKLIAEELGLKHDWKDITFGEATKDDIRRIQLALQDEDAEPASSDWAVKMGINIYYSAKQSKSPLYSKQIPYNSIIYEAFGQENPDTLTDYGEQRSGATKKRVVGWWCGKAWMSNQAHPLLARSKAMFAAKSHDKVQDEPSTLSNIMISRSPSKRISRKKRGDSMEKSGAEKKRCSATDDTALHGGSLGTNTETISDQSENFNVHDKHEGDEIEEAPSTQQYQQHKLQNVDMNLSSKKQKSDKRNSNLNEICDEDNDVDRWLNIDAGDNAAIGNLDNSPQGLDDAKAKSPGKLQGSKRKSSKGKASDDSLNGVKKLQKVNKKSISRKQNNGRLHDVESGVEATTGNLDNSQQPRLEAVKLKSVGKSQSCKRKSSKGKTNEDPPDGDKKLQVVNTKSSSRKQKVDSINRQFCEGPDEDNPMDYVPKDEDEATRDNCHKVSEEQTDDVKVKSRLKTQTVKKKTSKRQAGDKEAKFSCDIEGCDMFFSTQQDLLLHKRDICPVKGCKKKFFCHKYLLQHRKVHMDERPLKCTFKDCKKTFKWPWAKTEHMRVHTGDRPYKCKEPGCTQTFRFVSDFSRHKRKTGHSNDKRNKEST